MQIGQYTTCHQNTALVALHNAADRIASFKFMSGYAKTWQENQRNPWNISLSSFMALLPSPLKILQHILLIKTAQALKALEGNNYCQKYHTISVFAFEKSILCSRKKCLKIIILRITAYPQVLIYWVAFWDTVMLNRKNPKPTNFHRNGTAMPNLSLSSHGKRKKWRRKFNLFSLAHKNITSGLKSIYFFNEKPLLLLLETPTP